MLGQVMPKFDFKSQDAVALEKTLVEQMDQHRAVGLAANQIGIETSACAVKLSTGSIVLFNPMLTWLSTETISMDEGCLTFIGLYLPVKRPKEVQVTFQDSNGVRQVLDLKGWDARIVLHETDHLSGVLFTSRVSKLRLNMAKKKMHKNQK